MNRPLALLVLATWLGLSVLSHPSVLGHRHDVFVVVVGSLPAALTIHQACTKEHR